MKKAAAATMANKALTMKGTITHALKIQQAYHRVTVAQVAPSNHASQLMLSIAASNLANA